MARTLEISIVGDASQLEKAFGKAGKSTSKFGDGLKKASFVAAGALGAIGIAAKVGFGELMEAQKVSAQTGAVLESTGGIANVTAKQIEGLAGSLSQMSGVDDEAIQSGENLLATFTEIRNQAGKNNDVFNQTTKAALDMSVALGTDVKSAAMQLGKALNAPEKGLSKLTRSGVTFTDVQKKAVASMVKAGDTMGAQKLILAELNKEFGGSAKAAGDTFSGQMNKARNAMEEMAAGMVEALLPAMTRLAGTVSRLTAFLTEHKGATQAAVLAIAGLAAGVLAVNAGLKVYAAVTAAVKAATAAWTGVQWLLNAALTANPIGVVVVAIAALVAGLILAWKHSETFRRIVTGAFDAVRGAATAVLNFFRSNWPVIATLISGPFAPLVALATDAFGIRSKTIAAFTAIKNWVAGHWPEIATLISGPFAPLVALATDAFGVRSAMIGAFDAIKRAVFGVLDGIIGKFRWLAKNAGVLWGKAADGILGALDTLTGPLTVFGNLVAAIKNAIAWILDKAPEIPSIKLPSVDIPYVGKGRQHGGPVRAGWPYLVGERRPELFVPNTSGRILPSVPSMAMAGGGGMVVHNHFHIAGSVVAERELLSLVQRGALEYQRRNGGSWPG